MFVIIIIALWAGSAIAGWYLFWPWLTAPILVMSYYAYQKTARMREVLRRNGIGTDGVYRTSMAGPNMQLVAFTFVQHLAIFGVGAGLHWLIG